ncbi:hypothetical protein CBS101457_000739 [Exobasidium rhododendri]|nr:hypothetical protein CBS101457_000739 [Exobasidium rhododendri]
MGSKRPMQSLIMEILHAQPSLRDSKTYLNSFAPRPSNKNKAQEQEQPHQQQRRRRPNQPPFPFNISASTTTTTTPSQSSSSPSQSAATASSLFAPRERARKTDGGSSLQSPTSPSNDFANDHPSSHQFIQPEVADPISSTPSKVPRLQQNVTKATQSRLAESLTNWPVQQHTALVKVQGPFTPRQLESIAEGMVYLKRLGLVSIIIVDSEEESWRAAASSFSTKDGRRIKSEMDFEAGELAPWMTAQKQAGHTSNDVIGKLQEVLRKQMVLDVSKLSEALIQKGAPARPIPHAIMRVDADQVARYRKVFPPSLTSPSSIHHYQWAVERPSKDRSPLVSDDHLTSIRKALAGDMIPVIAPLALYEDPDSMNAPRTVCVSADDVLVGLAREMAGQGRLSEQQAMTTGEEVADDGVDIMPLRLMIINREGGIPSHARGGNPHLSINLASEYSHVANSFIWNESHPTALSNLSMVRDCLAYMPKTSSGVVVSHRSPKSLIANLITNKAAHSPSLPHRLLAGRQDVRHTPTIIRPGLDIRILQKYDEVDWDKMTRLLEASFKRKLNRKEYFARLQGNLDFVIVTGDYEGAAIVTHEYAPGEDPSTHKAIAYLDKFAVLPSLQGSGAVDFLWGALRDEVHGLGLLDALNDNGGKGGFGVGEDLVWKSRSDNPVNRWYYERSNGFTKIDTTLKKEGENTLPAWSMFWCDAEERIATMSGERRLAAEATQDDVMDAAKERVTTRDLQRALLRDDDDDDDDHGDDGGDRCNDDAGWGNAGRAREFKRGMQDGSESARSLSQLYPGDGSSRLLPVVAPEEYGRLQRWARCMSTIPTAWM